tara:strand:+ start:56 stop:775 length:720 start_codon:yes stop_codon:yes gene_type:complete
MNKDKIVGIHQPNFFPWLGYFNKIFKSDVFVILDDVQFPKKGGSWSNRVKIIISGESNWLTAPIVRNYSGVKKINEMEFNNFIEWKKKISKTIEVNYKKAPFYFEVEEFIMNLILNNENNIAKYNLKSIFDICKILEIDSKKIMLSSNIPHKGISNELLVSITKELKANIYLSGDGANGYIDETIFQQSNIDLKYLNYKPKKYNQYNLNEFISGLSIIDVLMNLGFEKSRNFFLDEVAI